MSRITPESERHMVEVIGNALAEHHNMLASNDDIRPRWEFYDVAEKIVHALDRGKFVKNGEDEFAVDFEYYPAIKESLDYVLFVKPNLQEADVNHGMVLDAVNELLQYEYIAWGLY